MEIDQLEEEISLKREVLRSLTTSGGLSTSVAKLSGSSHGIPSEKDFHFYNNFEEFKIPVDEIDKRSKYLLEKVGQSDNLFGKQMLFPSDAVVELDDDVGMDWLVAVNDEILERFDVSLDEFKGKRGEEESSGVRSMRIDKLEDSGFQIVTGKKNKKASHGSDRNGESGGSVKVAPKMKPQVPFHVPTIPRPQDEYRIIVNNSNQPFEHVWLTKSEDSSRFLHPLENFSYMDFVDKTDSIEPVEPLPTEVTPFTYVEEVKDLRKLATKLRGVDEFAVDLEHNQYRSFQGITCLMQISTRTEDFVIDTLKLRVHVGPHLREVFKNPKIRKVLHGSNHDILWLQRDFGIYVCNMFDTGQASRVLKLERNSLEYLLNHFCGVAANKEYQNADWRIRPLPEEMMKYAREDTHYLLYIYDLLRIRLLASPADSESSDPPLVDVYKRSYGLCMQLYEKELLTDASYLHIYGLHEADLNAQQLAVVSGLSQWRDTVARANDESTGYILPNRTLIEIAKQMPLTTNQLRRILKSKLQYIDRNLDATVSIIRQSIQNSSQFEEGVKLLKERRLEMASAGKPLATEESEIAPAEDPAVAKSDAKADSTVDPGAGSSSQQINDETVSVQNAAVPTQELHDSSNFQKSSTVTVKLLKKPSGGLGAMLGNSAKRKVEASKNEQAEETKLEQIKSSVNLPFHTFSGNNQPHEVKAAPASPLKTSDNALPTNDSAVATGGASLGDVINLDEDSDDEPSAGPDESKSADRNEAEAKVSLADLSSGFEECASSSSHAKTPDSSAPQSSTGLQLEPFDYEAARSQIKFGENRKQHSEGRQKDRNQKSPHPGQSQKDELSQGKRRQAFPASGNRSASFR